MRPERARLSADGALAGTVEQVVYDGADTTYHVGIAGGGTIRVRETNRDGAALRAPRGTAVSVAIDPAAIRVIAE